MSEATKQLDGVNICASGFEEIIKRATLNYRGKAQELETAIGALACGHIYGWKVLRLVHGGSAYAKYESILGVKFRELCPEVGPLAHRSLAYRVVESGANFWKVVNGVEPGRSPELQEA